MAWGKKEDKGAKNFNLSRADINPGGGLVAEKRTALLEQSRQLLDTAELQELGVKYHLLRAVPDQPDIHAERVSHFSEYVIGSMEQTLAEMAITDDIPDLSVSMSEGSMSASELTARGLLEHYMFALGVRDSLDEVTEIATDVDVDELSTLQPRFPREFLKTGFALEQNDAAVSIVPYYSVIREGLEHVSMEDVEERASQILEYTDEVASEDYRSGKIKWSWGL